LQKTARNFSPIILSLNLGTSPRQNKKFEGHHDLSGDMIFLNLTWDLMGIFSLWLLKKIGSKFLMKISRINKVALKN